MGGSVGGYFEVVKVEEGCLPLASDALHVCSFCSAEVPVMQCCGCPHAVAEREKVEALIRSKYGPHPKPATPEPPEWCRMCGGSLDARGVVVCDCTIPSLDKPPEWNGDIVAHMVFPDGSRRPITHDEYYKSPVTDAIAEFNERRKAKREGGQKWKYDKGRRTLVPIDQSKTVSEVLRDALNDRAATILARAMSTPLPHDPDMHTRLMPWRGK